MTKAKGGRRPCGSTDTVDGHPCRIMVAADATGCRHHAGDVVAERADRRAAFLEALDEELGSVVAACRRVGVSRAIAYGWREMHPDFRAAWIEICEGHTDALEQVSMRRAVYGWLEPVFWQGEQVGEVRKWAGDALVQFLLRARRRDVYGEQVDVTVRGDEEQVAELVQAFAGGGYLALASTARAIMAGESIEEAEIVDEDR